MKSLGGIRSGPSATSTLSSQSFSSFSSTSRMSILPSVRIPLMRRSENDDPPSHSKEPLLTIKLSSLSFLDSSVLEITSQSTIYTISTTGTSTTVLRNDPRRGSVKTAVIKWPRVLPTKQSGKDATECVLVQMKGSRWDLGDTVLKPGANSTRKFNIPNYSQSMKWRQYGSTYWCTTSAVKGPIAVMDRGNHTEPTKITIFETLHDKYDPKALSAVHGVSVLLLDYLLVTALLLVTDLQEWMLVKKYEEPLSTLFSTPGQPSTSSAPDLPSTSDSKLRKIFYGEPIFPKLSAAESRSKHSSSSTGAITPGLPQTPTTPNFGTLSINYADSYYTSSRPSSPRPGLPSIADTDINDYESFSFSEVGPTSPIPESIPFTSRPPSHNYFDPSFYGSQDQPPVPPLPLKYARSFNGRGAHSQPSSPLATTFGHSREFTQISVTEGFQRMVLLSSLEEPSESSSYSSSSHQQVTATRVERPQSSRSSMSHMSTLTSAAKRPLPRPPPITASASSPPTPRRVQSSSQLRSDAASPLSPAQQGTPPRPPSRPQRSLPPTPGIGLVLHDSGGAPPAPADANRHPRAQQHALLSPEGPLAHSRNPPITKASQEDLRHWVDTLTNPQRDLPSEPLPSTSIYDVPPPAYETINFARRKTQRQSNNNNGSS